MKRSAQMLNGYSSGVHADMTRRNDFITQQARDAFLINYDYERMMRRHTQTIRSQQIAAALNSNNQRVYQDGSNQFMDMQHIATNQGLIPHVAVDHMNEQGWIPRVADEHMSNQGLIPHVAVEHVSNQGLIPRVTDEHMSNQGLIPRVVDEHMSNQGLIPRVADEHVSNQGLIPRVADEHVNNHGILETLSLPQIPLFDIEHDAQQKYNYDYMTEFCDVIDEPLTNRQQLSINRHFNSKPGHITDKRPEQMEFQPSEDDIAFADGVWKNVEQEKRAIQYIIHENFKSRQGLDDIKRLYNCAKRKKINIRNKDDEIYNFCSNIMNVVDFMIQKMPKNGYIGHNIIPPSNISFVQKMMEWVMCD